MSLPRDLRDRLAKYCAAERTTESAVVSAALDQYLEGSSDKELLMRRLDRLDQAVGQVRYLLDLLSEAFATFLKIWFAHTPSIAPDGRRAALTVAEGRYRQFVEHLAAQWARGHRFAQDVARHCLSGGNEPPGPATNLSPPQRDAKDPGANGHGSR